MGKEYLVLLTRKEIQGRTTMREHPLGGCHQNGDDESSDEITKKLESSGKLGSKLAVPL